MAQKHKARSIRIFKVDNGYSVEVTNKSNKQVNSFNFRTKLMALSFVQRNFHLVGAYAKA